MACNNNNKFLAASSSSLSSMAAVMIVVVLLLFSSAANGQALLPVVGGLNVTGAVCCTVNLACPGAPLGGAVVKLNCTNLSGITRNVAQTVTLANGTFSISVSPLAGLLLRSPLSSLIPCTVSVQYPLAATTNCTLLSNSSSAGGILTAPVQAVGGLISTLFGLVQTAVAGVFNLLTF